MKGPLFATLALEHEAVIVRCVLWIGVAEPAHADPVHGVGFDHRPRRAPDRQPERKCVVQRFGLACPCGSAAFDAFGEALRAGLQREPGREQQHTGHAERRQSLRQLRQGEPQQKGQYAGIAGPGGTCAGQPDHRGERQRTGGEAFPAQAALCFDQHQGRQRGHHGTQLQIVVAKDATEPVHLIGTAQRHARHGLHQRIQCPQRDQKREATQRGDGGSRLREPVLCVQQERQETQVGGHFRPAFVGRHRVEGRQQFGQPVAQEQQPRESRRRFCP